MNTLLLPPRDVCRTWFARCTHLAVIGGFLAPRRSIPGRSLEVATQRASGIKHESPRCRAKSRPELPRPRRSRPRTGNNPSVVVGYEASRSSPGRTSPPTRAAMGWYRGLRSHTTTDLQRGQQRWRSWQEISARYCRACAAVPIRLRWTVAGVAPAHQGFPQCQPVPTIVPVYIGVTSVPAGQWRRTRCDRGSSLRPGLPLTADRGMIELRRARSRPSLCSGGPAG